MNFLINFHAPTQTFKILSRPQRTRLSNFKESPFAQCKALPRKWSQNIRKAIASILSSLPTSCPFCASMLRRCRQVLIVLTVLSFRFSRTVLQGRKWQHPFHGHASLFGVWSFLSLSSTRRAKKRKKRKKEKSFFRILFIQFCSKLCSKIAENLLNLSKFSPFFFTARRVEDKLRKDQTPTGDAWPWKGFCQFLQALKHSPGKSKREKRRTRRS